MSQYEQSDLPCHHDVPIVRPADCAIQGVAAKRGGTNCRLFKNQVLLKHRKTLVTATPDNEKDRLKQLSLLDGDLDERLSIYTNLRDQTSGPAASIVYYEPPF